MSPLLAAAGPSAYWYLARGTGTVALLLLTASVVFGVLGSLRFAAGTRWPRFTIDSLHRDVSLLVIAVLVVHIVTSVLDSFAPVKLTDAIIPFVSAYRPLWMGLGALAFDLLLALVITSLIRRRLGYRTWRAVHWLAYASWPVAVLHGLGTGSDIKSLWMLALTVVCVAAVVLAVGVRLARAAPEYGGVRAAGNALLILTPLGLAIFTLLGPLQSGWARRAGTPASLLSSHVVPTAAAQPADPARDTLKLPFTAPVSGTMTQTPVAGGSIVNLALKLGGGTHGSLRIRLGGASDTNGGVSLAGSQVDLIARGLASVAQGRIVSLQGQQVVARVTDASGSVMDLQANLNIDQNTGTVAGTLLGTAAGGGGQ